MVLARLVKKCMKIIQLILYFCKWLKQIDENMNYPYSTIVVVDDNSAILTALKICLAAEFEHVVTLTSPDMLVATLANEQNVDAVLLDMNFSLGVNTGQDGLFWLRTIKKLHPNTPVVLITAYADVQLAVNGLKYGAADFVTKPWDNDKLIGVLCDAIDSNREVCRSTRWSRNTCNGL